MAEKFVSLADVLGLNVPGEQKPVDSQPARKVTVKALCKEILASAEYREHLYRMIVRDDIPPGIEQMLYHYAEGKPVERLEVTEAPAKLEDLTVDQLETRVARLTEMLKVLRVEDTEPTGDAEPQSHGKVH